jgi:hypothetical protein
VPAPNAGPAGLQLVLEQINRRLSALEAPQGFVPAFLTTSAALNTASAAASGSTFAIATDLKTVVWSDGVHWYRADTGATIV